MFLIFGILLLLLVGIVLFLQHPKFGKLPSGERLAKIEQSPNYKNGKFQNQSFTPDLTEGTSYYSVLKQFLFEKKIPFFG